MNAIGTIPRSTPRHGVLDRAALALGEALVAWGSRRSLAPALDHEQAGLLIAARTEAEQIRRDRDWAMAHSYGWIR